MTNLINQITYIEFIFLLVSIFIFFISVSAIARRIAKRNNVSFLKLLMGLERSKSTALEKVLLIVSFAVPFVIFILIINKQ